MSFYELLQSTLGEHSTENVIIINNNTILL
jgi:hypothetical protein